jgi:group II intron reverse transcriptase/maturase
LRTTSISFGIVCRPAATFRHRCGGDIPKSDGKTRPLGIPTVADRIAQMVVKRHLEPLAEPKFHPDSYGYRPGKSALDAVGAARQRCWRHDWVLDLDIKAFFDSIETELLMRAVRKHTDCPWALLYIDRWLKAPVQMADGSLVGRESGTPQGGLSAPSWRISFFIMRSICGCAGVSRTHRSSAMPTMRFATRPSHGAADSS